MGCFVLGLRSDSTGAGRSISQWESYWSRSWTLLYWPWRITGEEEEEVAMTHHQERSEKRLCACHVLLHGRFCGLDGRNRLP